jgi:GT2 family glycosyltransferase
MENVGLTMVANTTIIVPIFNAFEALDICLAALLRTLNASAKVILANDASTDPRIEGLLQQFESRATFSVRTISREHNLGFPENCNRGFIEAGDDDVLLLNSDAIVTPDWLENMLALAAVDETIATITPWSNNAEICSFPHFCEYSPVPENYELIAQAAAMMPLDASHELPTAMGFCMWIRRAALRQCGDFDAATFGRGYGEENDLCRRFAAMSWRNILCTRAYVAHLGSQSFAPLNLGPGGENLQKLLARWPDYHEQVARFIMADPLKPLRAQLSENILRIQQQGPQGDLFGAMTQ